MKRDFRVFVSFFFLINLFLLFINDHYLKATYHNWWTGKLSDVTGLVVFPLFFTAFFPRFKKQIVILTALGFLFWKSPLSTSFIELWNQHLFYSVSRVVDYTDLWALLVLPIVYYYQPKIWIPQRRWLINGIGVLTFFVMVATSASDEYEQEYNWGFVEEKENGLKCITEKGICIKKVTASEHTSTYILTDTLGRPKNINNYNLIEVFTDSLLLIIRNGVRLDSESYQDRKWGLMTMEGEVLVEPQKYDRIYRFEWYADGDYQTHKYHYKISANNKTGLINKNGDVILEPIYDEIEPLKQDKELVIYRRNDEKGLMDIFGKKILESKYWKIERLNEHLIQVDSVVMEDHGKVLYIGLRDNEGNTIHPCSINYLANHQYKIHVIVDGKSKKLTPEGKLIKD